MRQLTANEILSISKLLQMESNSLAVAKAGINAIADEQLKTLAEAGISAGKARIMGLQQFINENNIISTEGVQQ